MMSSSISYKDVSVPCGRILLQGILSHPPMPIGLVVFSHGSGSGRHSPRNRFVADQLGHAGIATLLLDLLTPSEDEIYANRFDIALLTHRLSAAVDYAVQEEEFAALPIGLFGASTGAASAINVAAERPDVISAVVSRGGRPDLVESSVLAAVRAPTLFIVGARDREVLMLNQEACTQLNCKKEISVVPGATHLFEEPGTLEMVAQLSVRWFRSVFESARVPLTHSSARTPY